jgi:hypothetical protein
MARTLVNTIDISALDANDVALQNKDTAQDVEIATKDVKNVIINGGMEFAQRGTTASISGFYNEYLLDRWNGLNSSVNTALLTIEQNVDVPSDLAGFKSVNIVATTGAAVHPDGYVSIEQRVEGRNLIELQNKDMIFSFRVKSSNTGINSLFLSNDAFDQRLALEYTIDAADTWETKYITIPQRDFTSGFDLTSGLGLRVAFVCTAGAGTRQETHGGVWQVGAGGNTGVTGQVDNFVATNNYIRFTGCMLYDAIHGEVDFQRAGRDYAEEFKLCCRYYNKVTLTASGVVGTGLSYVSPNNLAEIQFALVAPLRTNPIFLINGIYVVYGAPISQVVASSSGAIYRPDSVQMTALIVAGASLGGIDAVTLYSSGGANNFWSVDAEL